MAMVFATATVALGADSGTELPPQSFHLSRTDGKRWDATFTVQHGPFHGVIYYAVPTDDPSQTIESAELFADTKRGRMNAERATDASPYKKPVFKLDLEAQAPFTAAAHVVVQFHRTTLEPGAPARQIEPLGRVQQKEFLDDGWPSENARQWFTQWMREHKLIRNGEDEAEFAFRVLKFEQKNFRYVIPDDIPEHKAMVEKDPAMGDWHYTIKTSTGECWRLSKLYDTVMPQQERDPAAAGQRQLAHRR